MKLADSPRLTVLLFQFIFSSAVHAVSFCEPLLTQADRTTVENVVMDFGRQALNVDLADSNQFPVELIEGDQSGHRLFLFEAFRWPLAVKIPGADQNIWHSLNDGQKMYLLKILVTVFRENESNTSIEDSKILERMTRDLGLQWSEIQTEHEQRVLAEVEPLGKNLPAWLPPSLQNVIRFLKFMNRSPGRYLEIYYEVLKEKLEALPEDKQNQIKGISAQRAFALLYETGKFTGVCRHAVSLFAAILLEMGAPPEDVQIQSGQFILPMLVGGHAWLRVRVNGKWRSVDPAPLAHAGLPSAFAKIEVGYVNLNTPLYKIYYPWFRKFEIPNGFRAFELSPKR